MKMLWKKALVAYLFHQLCILSTTEGILLTTENSTITDIDEDTTGVLNATEATPEQTLLDLENSMKELMGSIFKQTFSSVSKMGMPPKTSFSCLLSLANIYFGINRLEPWAFRMIDSSGKPSGGLLEGTTSALGDYDECLDVYIGGVVHPKSARGEYCLLEVKPPEVVVSALKKYQVNKGKGNSSLAQTKSFLGFLRKVRTNPDHILFRVGICMPSSCDKYEVQDVVDMVASRLDVDVHVVRCEFKGDVGYEAHEIFIIIFFCNVVALTATGTVVYWICQNGGCGNCAVLEPGPNALKYKNRWKLSKLFEILSNFSLCSSMKNLMNCTKEGDALDAIRGIKVLTVIFAIYAHTYALPHPMHLYRFRDTLNFTKFIDEVLFGIVANSSVGVDTIFFVAGFLFIYYRWRLLQKPPIFRYLGKFVLVNYLRMLTAQILVGFFLALLPLLGSGPLFEDFVGAPLQNCAKNWWMNLLFIQNFLSPYDSCLYHTWVLATMMQLFLVTAVIVWVLQRKPAIGISMNIVLIVTTAIAVAAVTVVYDFPATFTVYFYDFRTSIQYWKYLYVQSYNHLGPFCIGMLVAYFTAEYPPRKDKKIVVLCLWGVSVVTFCAIVFGLYHYREEQEMNRGLAVFYAALHRPAWALALSWVVYACATNNGGFVGSILTWKALIPVERLCYLAFLLHVPVMYYHGGVQRERMFMGHYNQIMSFLAYTAASFLLSLLCYLFFQAPYQTIERYIFGLHKDSIWESESKRASSEDLKTENSEKSEVELDNSKVLYKRYVQSGIS